MSTIDTIAAVVIAVCTVGSFFMQIATARKVEQVHLATNSMKDALVSATSAASHAQGMEDQRAKTAKEQGTQ